MSKKLLKRVERRPNYVRIKTGSNALLKHIDFSQKIER